MSNLSLLSIHNHKSVMQALLHYHNGRPTCALISDSFMERLLMSISSCSCRSAASSFTGVEYIAATGAPGGLIITGGGGPTIDGNNIKGRVGGGYEAGATMFGGGSFRLGVEGNWVTISVSMFSSRDCAAAGVKPLVTTGGGGTAEGGSMPAAAACW